MSHLLLFCLFAGMACAEEVAQVTVKQVQWVDGVETALAEDAYAATDTAFTSVSAPEVEGYRFAYWESSPAQPNFEVRNFWGRAYEQVSVVPKDQVVTLTAVYLPSGDEAEKIYWYGDTTVSMESDTDGDGYTFAQELQYGMNPHFPNVLKLGGVTYGDGKLLLYNPNEYQPYVIRPEPEGELFATVTNYVAPGTVVTTASYSPADSTFAYWTVAQGTDAGARDSGQEGGESGFDVAVRQADAFGRAVDSVSFTMPNAAVEVVAHCVADEQERMALYWYGRVTAADSDTDGDGYTFEQELQYGMNPIFKDELKLGGVTYGDSNLLLYNPNEYSPYTICSEPTNTFETITGYLKPSETYTTTSYAGDTSFAYWTLNGVRQSDAFGRAFDNVTITGTGAIDGGQTLVAYFNATNADEKAIAYWYGPDSGVTMASDTDGDGYTLAEEIQYGMNPHFKNELKLGGVTYGDGPTLETNLQPFDLGEKALVGGKLTDVFATLNASTGVLEGGLSMAGGVAVAILDVNGDGLFDLLVWSGAGLTLYRNIGAAGSADFEVVNNPYPALAVALEKMTRPILCGGEGQVAFCDNGGAISIYDLADDTITMTELVGYPLWNGAEFTVLEALTLDVAVENVVSATMADVTGDGILDLLVADAEGRISLYVRDGETYALQHRVWGGSYIGFASGLTLASVDWDGDGDMDMVCGTEDGKLVLLRDPGVGRPTNLRAAAGVDNVVLDWDPNGQSRVYGYKAYRAASETEAFGEIAETALPTYRDTPPDVSTWAYHVTALSRLWTAGNSKPEVFESAPSDIVSATLGQVLLSMPEEMTSLDNADIDVPLFINNSMGVARTGLNLTLKYDPSKLTAIKAATTALLSGELFIQSQIDEEKGEWTITSLEGDMAPGSGKLLSFRFEVKAGAVGETVVSLASASLSSATGQIMTVNTTDVATKIAVSERAQPAVVTFKMSDASAETGETVTIPVEVATTRPLDWDSLELSVAFDDAKLALVNGPLVPTDATSKTELVFRVLEQHGDDLFADVTLSGSATSSNGLAAAIHPSTCRILITDSDPPVVEPVLPAQVTLRTENLEAKTEKPATLVVKVTTVGEIDWETLVLTPTYDAAALALASATKDSQKSQVVFVFEVREQHGDNLSTEIKVTGTATSANGLAAEIHGASCTLTIVDSNPPKDPVKVIPWKNGNCNNDHVLDRDDYEAGKRVIMKYDGVLASKGNGIDHRIYRSVQEALGLGKKDVLFMGKHLPLFRQYIAEHCGEGKEKDK